MTSVKPNLALFPPSAFMKALQSRTLRQPIERTVPEALPGWNSTSDKVSPRRFDAAHSAAEC